MFFGSGVKAGEKNGFFPAGGDLYFTIKGN